MNVPRERQWSMLKPLEKAPQGYIQSGRRLDILPNSCAVWPNPCSVHCPKLLRGATAEKRQTAHQATGADADAHVRLQPKAIHKPWK